MVPRQGGGSDVGGVLVTFADDLRQLARDVRGIPGDMGIRPHRVYIQTSTFAGTYTGDGNRSTTETELTEGRGNPPKVRWLKADEITVGSLPAGSVKIGPITAQHPGSPVTAALLQARDAQEGDLRHVRIVGPMHPTGALYRLVSANLDRAIHYTLTASPVEPLV